MKLHLLGSSRNDADAQLVQSLQQQAVELGLTNTNVEFVVNAPYSKLQELMQTVSIGIHCMWNEHFGISIVEMMAAGMVMIAHNSGGPQKDIMVPLKDGQIVGYVAASIEEYADRLADALSLSAGEAMRVRLSARQSVQERFGDMVIEEQVVALFNHILHKNPDYKGNVIKEESSSGYSASASSKRRSIKRKSVSKK